MNFLRRSQQAVPPQKLGGRYKVINQLGVGGFSQTFLAQDLHLPGNPLCVVKQFKPQVADPVQLKTASRLFNTEAKVLYQLGEHPQIPRLLAHFEEEQEFYLVQEYIEGQPLSKLLTGQAWSQQQVIALLQDLLQILVFVHQQSVIHRDIKPSNLMHRNHDGRIVLIDFGAVKQVSTQLTESHTGLLTVSIGTQGYMPMEQLSGNPRFSSDLYAAGVVCIQALTGMSPKRFKSDLQTGEIVWRDLRPDSQPGQAGVNPGLAAILDRMVCYHFRDRYQSAEAALQALQALLVEHPELMQPEAAPQLTDLLPEISSSPLPSVEAESASPDSLDLIDEPTQSLTAPHIPVRPPVTELVTDPPTESGSIPGEKLAEPDDQTNDQTNQTDNQTNDQTDDQTNNQTDQTDDTANDGATAADLATALGSDTEIGTGSNASLQPALDASVKLDEASVFPTAFTPHEAAPPAPTPLPVIISEVTVGELTANEPVLLHQPMPPVQPTEAQPPIPPRVQLEPQPDASLPKQTAEDLSELVPTTHVAPVAVWEQPSPSRENRPLPWKLLLGAGLAIVVAIPFFSQFLRPQVQSGINPAALANLPCQEPSLPSLPSGEADYQYPDGTRYYGAVRQGVPVDGRGIMVFPSGNRYDGEFQNGKRNGCGTLTFTNRRSYVGQFKDDQFNGQGIWTLETGDLYVGSFLDNRCHGEGTFVFADGSSKQGRWQDGNLMGSDLQCDP